jgi:hypothetical protein
MRVSDNPIVNSAKTIFGRIKDNVSAIDKLILTDEEKNNLATYLTDANTFYENNKDILRNQRNDFKGYNKIDIMTYSDLKDIIKNNITLNFETLENRSEKLPQCKALLEKIMKSYNSTSLESPKKANKFASDIFKDLELNGTKFNSLENMLRFAIKIYGLPQSTDVSTGGKRRRRSTKKRKSSKKSRKARRSRRHRRNRSSKK